MTVSKPNITWIGTNGRNIWAGRGQKKLAVVCHIAEGAIEAVDSWFSNALAQASANYCVAKDGRIHCYVDPLGADAPYANGIINQPSAAVLALLTLTGRVNPNFWTASIEHEGHSGDVMPPVQLDASAHLTAWLCERFAIPADEDHLLGHYEFDDVTRHGCPGWNRAQWVGYEAAVTAYLNPAPVPTPTPDPTPPSPQPDPLEQIRQDEASARARIAKAIAELAEATADISGH